MHAIEQTFMQISKVYTCEVNFVSETPKRKVLKEMIRVVKPCVLPVCWVNTQARKYGIIGTSFIVNSNGYIITCEHVVRNLSRTFVLLDEQPVEADLIHISAERDFAILKIEREGLIFLELGNFDDIEEGEDVFFCGYPFGMLRFTTHRGIISHKGEFGFGERMIPSDAFQIDGIINKGFSGGPIFSMEDSKVIGVLRSTYGDIGDYLRAIAEGRIQCRGIGLGQIDFGLFTTQVVDAVARHIQMGMGYAVSINYANQKLEELDVIS